MEIIHKININNFGCPYFGKSSYLCYVVLDSSRDDWNQVEASNRCSPMKGFPFGRLFLFVKPNFERISKLLVELIPPQGGIFS